MSNRPNSSKGSSIPSGQRLHFELRASLRKDRARIGRISRNIYGIACRIIRDGGGSGPWLILVDQDPPSPKTTRLRTVLGLRPDEDLWMETAFYPNKVRMKNIIRQIWKEQKVVAQADMLASVFQKEGSVIKELLHTLHYLLSSLVHG